MKTLGKYWVFNLDCHVIKQSEAGELLFLRNIYVREIQNSKKKVEIEINYFGHCSKYIDISLLYIQIRLKSATNCLKFFQGDCKEVLMTSAVMIQIKTQKRLVKTIISGVRHAQTIRFFCNIVRHLHTYFTYTHVDSSTPSLMTKIW